MRIYSLSLSLIAVLLFAGSSMSFMPEKVTFSANVKGVEDRDLAKEGIKVSEFSELTILSSDSNVEVKEFIITFALETRAMYQDVVIGNTFDMTKYSDKVTADNRIVIEITKVSSDFELIDMTYDNSVILISLIP